MELTQEQIKELSLFIYHYATINENKKIMVIFNESKNADVAINIINNINKYYNKYSVSLHHNKPKITLNNSRALLFENGSFIKVYVKKERAPLPGLRLAIKDLNINDFILIDNRIIYFKNNEMIELDVLTLQEINTIQRIDDLNIIDKDLYNKTRIQIVDLTFEQKQNISKSIACYFINFKKENYKFIFNKSFKDNIFNAITNVKESNHIIYKLVNNPNYRLYHLNENFEIINISDDFYINSDTNTNNILLDYLIKFNINYKNFPIFILEDRTKKEITIFKNDISESDIVKIKEYKLSKEIDLIGGELYNEVFAQL